MREALREFDVPVDSVLATPDDLARQGDLVGTVLRPTLRDGKVIYEREAVSIDDVAGRSREEARCVPGPVSAADRLAETKARLESAEEDLEHFAVGLSEQVDERDESRFG